MTHTTNYNLSKFESSDAVESAISALNANMDTIDTVFGGVKLCKLTQAEYDALPVKDEDTLYIVMPDGGET